MGSTERLVIRVTAEGTRSFVDNLATEGPAELRIGTTPIAVVMRTPGRDEDLFLGFALTEGIVLRPDEVGSIEEFGPDRWNLRLVDGVAVDPEQFRRNLYSTSSCGVCGKASIDAVRIAAPPLPAGPRLEPAILSALPERLRANQPLFESTGGLHGACLFEPDGTLLAGAEDVGRHNAVDKVIGAVARRRWPIGETVMMVSGRVSFEIAQKAAVAGIPVVAGVSAASSLGAELAAEVGMTVVGFLRDGECVVYAGAERIAAGGPVGIPEGGEVGVREE